MSQRFKLALCAVMLAAIVVGCSGKATQTGPSIPAA